MRRCMVAWRSQFKRQREMFERKFVEYWSSKMSSTSGNSKTLWSHLRCPLSQPASTGIADSADEFTKHFSDKITRVRQSTSGFSQPTINSRQIGAQLSNFRPVTVDERLPNSASLIRPIADMAS